MTDFVLGPNQTKWIEALESGSYKQCKGALRRIDGAMCCLGVAAHIFAEEQGVVPELSTSKNYEDCYDYLGDHSIAPLYVRSALSLNDAVGGAKGEMKTYALVSLNDSHNYSFAQIAEHLRKNPESYFTAST